MRQLRIKLFCDGANRDEILSMNRDPRIQGFTTNPTLMRKAGISDYRGFAIDILKSVTEKPISFEVFADDFSDMYRQAKEIRSWGENVYVKIPIMNTKRQYAYELIQQLTGEGTKLNITAMCTLEQVSGTVKALRGTPGAVVSVFAGRIADTGVDPLPLMMKALSEVKTEPKAELLWASPRELFNVIQADEMGCHIITATGDILKKLNLLGKNLEDYSQETVQMFYNDAQSSGFTI